MKTILIPTDFSATAKNAALYAIEFAKQVGAMRLILYHAFQVPVGGDPVTPAMELFDIDALKQSGEQELKRFQLQLKAFAGDHINIDTMHEFALLSDGLDDVCDKTGATLIIMGITGGTPMEEKLFGSNAINVARNGKVPVIIVPPQAMFSKIEEILLACDFKKPAENIPVQPLKEILTITGAKLLVLNVNHHPDIQENESVLKEGPLDNLLQGCNPQYFFVESEDFIQAIHSFSEEKKIDLIIIIPHQKNWFEGLFSKNHTKMLAFHSHVPLMVAHV